LFADILFNATENTEDLDSFGSELQEIIDSPASEKTNKPKSNLKELENVTLNIAVTGMTGAGKSSLVNALRGLPNDDKNAAPTGTTETTMQPNMYPHPSMPNVKIWDLPGIGSPKFRAKKYLKDVSFHRYDFFLIVTSERFKENDIELARAIMMSKKLFYFIRTKIDNDIHAESHKRNFDERMLLENIREDCKANLLRVGIPKIFLVSSFNLEKYDFQKLINTLEDELPENKKFALIQSLAIAPIPGLSLACDYGFSLSNQGLEALSDGVNKLVEQLKAAMTSPLQAGGTAIASVHYLLNMGLNEMAEDTKCVLSVTPEVSISCTLRNPSF
uniref:IRG-type G domain-containing protein n=1 Tax=Cyprinus carpio TaxID=7962 RepID=A0A8C1XG23_CYPCA